MRLLRLPLISLVLLGGCATHRPLGGTPAAVTGTEAPPAAPLPKDCPAEIAADNSIEGSSSPLARTRVDEFGPGALQLSADDEGRAPTFAEARATLETGELGLFMGNRGTAIRALLLRPDEPGACVVTGWETALAGKITLQQLQRWTSPDRQVAVFVLGYLHEYEGRPPDQRWVTVATDGRRAWSPLKGGASAQLLAREAVLRPQSGKLYLDVRVKGPGATVFAFRPETGLFEQLR